MAVDPHVDVHRGAAPLVPFLDQYALPERFAASVTPAETDLPACHLEIVVEGGRAICTDLRLQRRPGGAPLSGALLRRIPVAEYVRRAVDHAGQWRVAGRGPMTVTADGETYPLSSEPAGEGHVAIPIVGMTRTKEFKAATRAPREAGRIREETLVEVADVYRTAHTRGEAPTQAVVEEWNVSRSTASRWVKRARDAGILGPALPRMAGEAPVGSP